METKSWISENTRAMQAAAAQLAADLTTTNCKAAGTIATDGDIEAQTKALATLRAKAEVMGARLGRAREALYEALVNDARVNATATDQALKECTATLHAERLGWAEQCRCHRNRLAGDKMEKDRHFWPAALVDRETEVRLLRDRNAEANKVLRLIDIVFYRATAGSATPISGRRPDENDARREAAKIIPEVIG
jgi:hypothetical protein